MKSKDETLDAFKKFVARAENELGKHVVRFRSDGGGEYYSKEFAAFCAEKGIVQEKTNPDTPQQNGVAERKNQTLNNKARSMLAGAGLTALFWVSAIQHANWITNRSPTRAIPEDKTPFEAFYNQKPSLLSLREYGCQAWVQIPKKHRAKFDHQSIQCQYLGFAKGKKAFLLFDPANRRIIESRDVKFHEDADKERIILANDDDEDWVEEEGATGRDVDAGVELSASGGDVDIENRSTTPPVNDDEDTATEPTPSPIAPPPLRRSGRTRRAPTPDDDPKFFVGSRNPKEPILAPEDETSEIADFSAFMSTTEPQSYKEAMRREDASSWLEAMAVEMTSQRKVGTFVEVPRPADANILPCRWVYAFKLGADGETTIYKARLVAKGFGQRPGEDFNETFAPTLHKSSLLTLLAIAAREDLEIDQMDVKTAFLNGDLEEEIYMQPPEGFPPKVRGHVWRLQKSIYGLRQSARQWYQKLKGELVNLGYTRTATDHAVFIRRTGGFCCVAFHVDDLITLANGLKAKLQMKKELSERFETKDLGKVRLFCGLEITRDRSARTITIGQEHYCSAILERFGLENARPVSTPMSASLQLAKLETPTVDIHKYQSMLGSLMYAATGTRPDIAFTVNTLAQHATAPGEPHLHAVKRVFQYLAGTCGYKLAFNGHANDSLLVGYVDADWAGDANTRRSVSGYVFLLGGTPITWAAKKQPSISLSSTESEYMASALATREAVYLRQFLIEIGFRPPGPIPLLIDNQSAIALARNPEFHARTKHIEVRHHYVREKIEDGVVDLQYCPTGDQIADIFTKALPIVKHSKFVKDLSIL